MLYVNVKIFLTYIVRYIWDCEINLRQMVLQLAKGYSKCSIYAGVTFCKKSYKC